MALTLSEDLIRNRVGLEHDKLEDVKSLALPGTYHEKVVSLGSSLRKFSRLKHLDLSRNNITCLQGLEHLKLLEKLNLYYNNIETLEELKRLKHNPNLKELDLRLNPVTRTETDYRLYLIHMLPSLQKLDDRSVRDRERQGALIHFSSSQATEMTAHPQRHEAPPPHVNPRVEHVKSVGSGKALEDDDVELLDLIARTGGDLSKPRPLTGSNSRDPDVEDYSLQGLKRLAKQPEDGPERKAPPRSKPNTGNPELDELMHEYKRKYPNIPDVLVTNAKDGTGRPFGQDPNLEFEDEAEAYNKFKSHGFFTPNPANGDGSNSGTYVPAERDLSAPSRPSDDYQSPVDSDRSPGHRRAYSVPADRQQFESVDKPSVERYSDEPERPSRGRQPATTDSLPPKRDSSVPLKAENPESRLFLFQVLDLVDRYWNGSKSLHKNNKFKGLAYSAIDSYLRTLSEDRGQQEVQQLRDELGALRKDNARLRRNEDLTKSSLEDTAATEAHLKASLQKAFTDVEMLKDKLQTYASENKRLQQKAKQLDSFSTQSVNQTQLDGIHAENDKLKREVEKQQIQLKQFKQLQELSSMLQESHKSLVQTNDHLLKELDESRQRHQHEVEQLNWSYNQLKKSMSEPPRPASYSSQSYGHGSTLKGDGNASAVLYDSDN